MRRAKAKRVVTPALVTNQQPLRTLTALQSLDLSHTQVADRYVEELRAALPSVTTTRQRVMSWTRLGRHGSGADVAEGDVVELSGAFAAVSPR